MKANFGLPDCTYNIHLSKTELEQLLEKGHIVGSIGKTIPCTTGRAAINKDMTGLDILDRKEIYNGLMFDLSENVADIEANEHPWPVQFLVISVDKEGQS